jgi:hypothetical protein
MYGGRYAYDPEVFDDHDRLRACEENERASWMNEAGEEMPVGAAVQPFEEDMAEGEYGDAGRYDENGELRRDYAEGMGVEEAKGGEVAAAAAPLESDGGGDGDGARRSTRVRLQNVPLNISALGGKGQSYALAARRSSNSAGVDGGAETGVVTGVGVVEADPALYGRPPQNRRDMLLRTDRDLFLAAEQAEYTALNNMGAVQPVLVRRGTFVLPFKHVYTVKDDGRHKVRLVACGNLLKQEGAPETTSPTARKSSILIVFAVAQQMGHCVRCMDVTTAYLYGLIPEGHVYHMRVPDNYRTGLVADAQHEVALLLKRALYGLPFSGRSWWVHIAAHLRTIAFLPTVSDPCVYTRGSACIVLYVDDLLVSAPTLAEVTRIMAQLVRRYKMTDLGDVARYIGMQVRRTDEHMTVHQHDYIRSMLAEYGAGDTAVTATPARHDQILTASMSPAAGSTEAADMGRLPYRSLVGSLLYAAVCTRVDIVKAVSNLGSFVQNPGMAHWRAALYLLRYLRGTADLGVRYTGDGTRLAAGVVLTAFADASYADQWSVGDGRSVTGYVLYLCGGPVLWGSHRQATPALSTAEAEYEALTACTREVVWVRGLLSELGFRQAAPTTVYEDNQAAIGMSKSVSLTRMTKHVVVRCAFLRHHLDAGAVTITYCPTLCMLADVLTKIQGRVVFVRLRGQLLGYEVWTVSM